MPGPAHLSGKLPDGDANGLAAIARALIDDPRRIHVVVALVDTAKITQTCDDGARVATVRIRRVEAISDPADRGRLQTLLRREYERRTGQTVLPFDLEEDVRSAFGEPHPDDDAQQE